MRRRLFRGLGWGALAVLSLSMACVDKIGGDTGLAPLYVYDGASNSVLVWDDINDLYDDATASKTIPGPNRTIDLNTAAPGLKLSWGGMALDSTDQRLFLVSQDGSQVVRILRSGTQTGTPSTSEYITFSIPSDGPGALTSNVFFGQVATNSSGDLVVTESDDTKSQIWKLSKAIQDATQTPSSTPIAKDTTNVINYVATDNTKCTGVALDGKNVYAYFGGGTSIQPDPTTTYSGARLRYGNFTDGFTTAQNVIIDVVSGTTCRLADYGCLAYDTSNKRLYTATKDTSYPILVHRQEPFNQKFKQPPTSLLTGPNNGNLRIIAHAGQKDWLVGAESSDGVNTQGAGASTLWIWKGPSVGDTHVSLTLPGSLKILGLALDGSQ